MAMNTIILILCFLGEISSQLEHFSANECKFGDNDLTIWGLSYIQCLQECRARPMCISINLNPNLRECRLHIDNTTATLPCLFYLYSEKSNWKKKKLCDEQHRCPLQPNVKINSDCECQISECPPLTIPKNAIILGNGRLIGHSIVYACINELNITTEYHRQNCTQPGVWSGESVNCPDIVPPVSDPGVDPIPTNEPTTAISLTTGPTTSTITAKTTTISTTTMATTQTDTTTMTIPDPPTLQTQPTSFEPSTTDPVDTVNPVQPSATKTSTSSAKTTTSTPTKTTPKTSGSTNPRTTTSSTGTPQEQSGSASLRTTISTTTASTQSASISPRTTTILPPTDQSTISSTWFFSTYNISCSQMEPDVCDTSFDLECRLNRCQCQPPNVLDLSAETCTSACPSLTDVDEGMYGDTYQEYEYFDLRPSGTVKKNSVLWPISFGSVLESAEGVMSEFVLKCTSDVSCRAVHGYTIANSLNVTTYFGTGLVDVIPTTVSTDFMHLYVRDCGLRNSTETSISI